MIPFEVHPEIHVRELRDHPSFSTCSGWHRRFHAKSEDQLSWSLCQHCLDAMQSHRTLSTSAPRAQRGPRPNLRRPLCACSSPLSGLRPLP